MATPKQVRTRGRFSLLLGAILATVLFAAVAYADNVQNDAGTTTGVTTITEVDPPSSPIESSPTMRTAM